MDGHLQKMRKILRLQGGVDSEDDELEDEVLVNEAEELEQVNESAFARLMASNIDESRCVAPQVSKYPVP